MTKFALIQSVLNIKFKIRFSP